MGGGDSSEGQQACHWPHIETHTQVVVVVSFSRKCQKGAPSSSRRLVPKASAFSANNILQILPLSSFGSSLGRAGWIGMSEQEN